VVASGRKRASGAASASARGQVSATGGRVGAVPDLIEPLELVVADHALSLVVVDHALSLVVVDHALSLVVVDGSAAAEVADRSAAASVADNRTRVVETY
jgi:hypothetical protein